MMLAGIDLAWKGNTNTSAAAFGNLDGSCLHLNKIYPALECLAQLTSVIESEDQLLGLAIDAPLIINNEYGQRECERQLGREYGVRGASCHSSNLSLYPDPVGVRLSLYLKGRGFEHLQDASEGKFQIECYPHPAMIEIFNLERRLRYKKGKLSEKIQGQIELSKLIRALEKSRVISLVTSGECREFLEEERICSLAGANLKVNEDVLDSIVCLYICALFATSTKPTRIYGSIENGYIYVPKLMCILKPRNDRI